MSKTQYITLRVIILFLIAILSTFIPEYFTTFFGDWKCDIIGKSHHFDSTRYYSIHYHWGYRHCLYSIMCVTLFIIQIVDIVNYCNKKY